MNLETGGILDRNLIAVGRARLRPSGRIVLAVVDGQITVKEPAKREGRWFLDPRDGFEAIAIGRLRLDARTQDYVARRIAAGNSKLEAIRCLKRYIVREVFGIIMRRHMEINQSQIAA